jgi:hypothetical protein
MKIKQRIVPFTTVLLCNDCDFNDLVMQTVKWCSSDSFNPAGRAYIVNVETHTISIVNRLREKKIRPKKEFSKLSLIYFILKIKPSFLISFSQRKTAKAILFLSRSGRTVYKKGLFSFFFSDTSFSLLENKVSLLKAAPYLFNSETGDRFSGRGTSFRGFASENPDDGDIEIIDNDELMLDLGEIPVEPEGAILWIPRRTTFKTVWTDFIKITFFAAKTKCKIFVHMRNSNELKKFSSIFFIKGRKPDMDKYLSFAESKDIFEILSDPQKYKIENLKNIVFSFGLTAEYNKVLRKIRENGGGELNLTTIKRIEDA